MIIRKLSIFITAVVLLTACSQEELDVAPVADDEAICFSAYTDADVWFSASSGAVATRGSVFTPTDLQNGGIGVFAFYQKAKSNGYPMYFHKNIGEPSFMYNQHVTYDDATWSYEPAKYWPNSPNDLVSFFAYAPYNEATAWEDLQIETNLSGTIITRRYTVEDEVSDQQDVLWANPMLNKTKMAVGIPVSFTFRHLCARLGVTAKVESGESGYYYTLDTICLSGAFHTAGTLVYTVSDGTCVWQDFKTEDKTYTLFHTSDGSTPVTPITITATEQPMPNANGYVFMLPGTQDITLTATACKRSNSDGSVAKTYRISKDMPAMTLEENRTYTFKVNVLDDE